MVAPIIIASLALTLITIASVALVVVGTLTPLANNHPLRQRSPTLLAVTALVHPLAYAVVSLDIFVNRLPQFGFTRIATYLWWVLYSLYAWSFLARLFLQAARFVAQADVISKSSSSNGHSGSHEGRRGHHRGTGSSSSSSSSSSGRSGGTNSRFVRFIASLLVQDVGSRTLGFLFVLGALIIHGVLLLAAIGLVGFDKWSEDGGNSDISYDEPYIVHFSALGLTALVSLYGAYVMGNSPRDHTRIVAETRNLALMWLAYTVLIWVPTSFVVDDGVPTYLLALPPLLASLVLSVVYPVYQASRHRLVSTISAEYTAAVDFPSPPSEDTSSTRASTATTTSQSTRTPVRPPPRTSEMQVVTASPRAPDEVQSVEWHGRIRSLSDLRAASNRYLFPAFAKFLASELEAHLLLFIEDVRVWRGLPSSAPEKAQLALHICRQYLTQHSFMRIWGLPPVTIDEYRNPGSLPPDFFDARLRAVSRHLQNDSLPRFFASEEFIMAERADVAQASGRSASGARAARGTTEGFMSEIDHAYGRFFQDAPAAPAPRSQRRTRRGSTRSLRVSRHSSKANLSSAPSSSSASYATNTNPAFAGASTDSHYHQTSLYPQPM
jgi:hypothetical protein